MTDFLVSELTPKKPQFNIEGEMQRFSLAPLSPERVACNLSVNGTLLQAAEQMSGDIQRCRCPMTGKKEVDLGDFHASLGLVGG